MLSGSRCSQLPAKIVYLLTRSFGVVTRSNTLVKKNRAKNTRQYEENSCVDPK